MSFYCVFCEIIAHREPATILHEDDDVIVFRNLLNWVPVMLLAVPREHMLQGELWTSDVDREGGGRGGGAWARSTAPAASAC